MSLSTLYHSVTISGYLVLCVVSNECVFIYLLCIIFFLVCTKTYFEWWVLGGKNPFCTFLPCLRLPVEQKHISKCCSKWFHCSLTYLLTKVQLWHLVRSQTCVIINTIYSIIFIHLFQLCSSHFPIANSPPTNPTIDITIVFLATDLQNVGVLCMESSIIFSFLTDSLPFTWLFQCLRSYLVVVRLRV